MSTRKPTVFEEKVYAACRRIPRGRVTTYQLLGEAIGCGAARAIGQALRKNPYAPATPCHRVVAADRGIGGYNGKTSGEQIDRKLQLLKEEGVTPDVDGRVPEALVWAFPNESARPSITTRVGDKGFTRLFSGEEVSKASPRPEAYGDLDELVSQLGVARSLLPPADALARAILALQDELFVAGAELATTGKGLLRLKKRVDERMADALDDRCRALESLLPPATGFILPGATPAGAFLDVARSISRRLERKVVALVAAGELSNPPLLRWLNRLSDYLWLMARQAEGGNSTLKT